VVKLHPGESTARYERLLRGRLGPRARLVLDEDFVTTASKADLVIGAPSTALLEAMAMGVPVLLTNFDGAEAAAPFDGAWDLKVHRTPAELKAALERWLPSGLPASVDYSRTLEAFFGPADGRSADRILAALGA
jgi:glycosyltransferase involved in cell wall biosynthesis